LPEPAFREETSTAIAAVGRGMELALQRSDAGMVVSKGVRDIVTGTDIAVEDALRGILSEAFAIPIVGEERGGERPRDGSAFWLIDPICGTANFASGTPLYCVNVALVENGEVVVAVAGDPGRDEISVAEKGRGAWVVKNGVRERILASDASEVVVVDDAASKGARREHAARFVAATIAADRWYFRSLGTTLVLPYLAAGRVAAYAAFQATSLHCAAGCLLATEAGGVVTDVLGEPLTLDSETLLVAANTHLHAELVELSVGSV
jgi:myo-inositol-1(or 4)-monophosphatase